MACLTPKTARDAARFGADGIVVSDHGGRLLRRRRFDCAGLAVGGGAVGDRLTVLADPRIRSGADVVRMLALGAQGCCWGAHGPMPWQRRARPAWCVCSTSLRRRCGHARPGEVPARLREVDTSLLDMREVRAATAAHAACPRSGGIPVLGERFGFISIENPPFRGHVAADRITQGSTKMLVQVIDIFDHTALTRAGEAEIVDHRRCWTYSHSPTPPCMRL